VEVPAGPTGMGTSAAHLFSRRQGSDTVSGTGSVPGAPALYGPSAMRDDPVLADEVDERLVAWAEETGIYAGRYDDLRATGFGDLMMLCHPETSDPDRLLAAGKCALAEWATDDHYCDDESFGASPALLAGRLGIAATAMDPSSFPAAYAPAFRAAVGGDPVLTALRSALRHTARYATWEQIARLRSEICHLFIGYGHEAAWRLAGRTPAVWEYLACRQNNSFRPCIALVDVVAGYELPTEAFAEPRLRRAFTLAGTAATIVNDLYSLPKALSAGQPDISLPTVIAAEEKCSLKDAIARTVRIHDELVRTFESESAALSAVSPPPVQRFLGGVWAWLGGNLEWHGRTARYNAP
jgi:2-methylisoborneol synthase